MYVIRRKMIKDTILYISIIKNGMCISFYINMVIWYNETRTYLRLVNLYVIFLKVFK